jgi:hypothetical protein
MHRLTDEEVWLRADCAAIAGPYGTDEARVAERVLEQFRKRFPVEAVPVEPEMVVEWRREIASDAANANGYILRVDWGGGDTLWGYNLLDAGTMSVVALGSGFGNIVFARKAAEAALRKELVR